MAVSGSLGLVLHLLALAGALPALIAMFLVDRADARRPEPRSTLRRVALAGALMTLPAGLLELLLQRAGPARGPWAPLYVGFVVAGVVEEAAKWLVVRWVVWRRPEFDERTDGIVYGARAGLGFALLENVGYLLGAKTMSVFVTIFVARALLTIPMHAATGALSAHYAAWRRFEGRGPGLAGGYALAVALHGGFDACLLALNACAAEKRYGAALLLLVGAVAFVAAGLAALRRAWRRALAADEREVAAGALLAA